MPDLELSIEAQKDLTWLRRRLGAARVTGPEADPDFDCFMVTLVKSDGKHTWTFGDSPEKALANARRVVEQKTKRA